LVKEKESDKYVFPSLSLEEVNQVSLNEAKVNLFKSISEGKLWNVVYNEIFPKYVIKKKLKEEDTLVKENIYYFLASHMYGEIALNTNKLDDFKWIEIDNLKEFLKTNA
jgi:hypothetical protein